MLIVLSIYHCADGRDYTFIHGVFQDEQVAIKVANDVRLNPSYIAEEGYDYDDQNDRGITVEIMTVPGGVRINEFVPFDY